MGQHTHGFLLLPAPAPPHWMELQGGHSAQEVTSTSWVPSFPSLEKNQAKSRFMNCWACLGWFLPWMICSRRWTLGRTCGLWLFCNQRTPVPLSWRKTGAQTCDRERLREISSQKSHFKNLVPEGLNAATTL